MRERYFLDFTLVISLVLLLRNVIHGTRILLKMICILFVFIGFFYPFETTFSVVLTLFFVQVTYDTTGFLEKNRDLLHYDSIELLSSCSCHLPQIFASNMLIQSEKPVVGPLYKSGGADSQKLSVATKFKVRWSLLQVFLYCDLITWRVHLNVILSFVHSKFRLMICNA